MAKIRDMTAEQIAAWREWVASRPPTVRAMAERFPPDRLYRIKSTGQRVEVYSFFENGTLAVLVLGRWNLVAFERQVFGIKPDDLEECDLPAADELCGSAGLDPHDAAAYMRRQN